MGVPVVSEDVEGVRGGVPRGSGWAFRGPRGPRGRVYGVRRINGDI